MFATTALLACENFLSTAARVAINLLTLPIAICNRIDVISPKSLADDKSFRKADTIVLKLIGLTLCD